METKFYDDGQGQIWHLSAGAYGDHSAIVRCNVDDLPDALYAVFPGLFEPVDYPERGEDENNDDYYSRCEEAEIDLTVVDCHGIPSWEWTFVEAHATAVVAWKIWFAEQYM